MCSVIQSYQKNSKKLEVMILMIVIQRLEVMIQNDSSHVEEKDNLLKVPIN